MPSFKTPTQAQIEAAVQRMRSPEFAAYFLSRLENPKWIAPLAENGLFASPPPAVRTEEGGVGYPHWPASKYLARMAAETPVEVAEIFAGIRTDNAMVIGDMVDAAVAMPANVAALLVPAVCRAAAEGTLWWNHFKEAGDLCVRLAEGGEAGAAMQLAEALFTPTFKEGEDELSRLDEHWYKEGLSRVVPALATARARVFVPKVCEWLLAAVEAKGYVDSESGRDGSYTWRPAIEKHGQNHDYDFAGVMVGFVREGLELAIQGQHLSLPEGLGFVERYPYLVFARIKLHLIRVFAEQAPDLARQCMLNHEYFSDVLFRHEYALLLRDRFGMLTPDEQQVILGWINDGPDRSETREMLEERLGDRFTEDKVDKYVQAWQRDRLSWFSESLPPEWQERYGQLVEAVGPPDHADFPFWMDSGLQWGGEKPPKDATELSAMSTDDLVAYLRSWRPDPSQHMGPTLRDQATAFETTVEKDLQRFVTEAVAFADLHPTYVSRFLSKYMIAIQNDAEVPFEPLVDLCLVVVQKPVQLPKEQQVGGDPFDADPSWEYAKNTVADLIRQMCDHNAPFTLREKLWACLAPLEEAPDRSHLVGEPAEDMRTLVWLDHACNNPRAELIHAVIRYAAWVKKCTMAASGVKDSEVGMDAVPEARDLLERHIRADCGESPAVHSEFGTHFTALCWVDESWAIDHASDIFPLAGPHSAYGWAAWNSYLVASRTYDRIFRGIRNVYTQAISQLTPDLAKGDSRFNPLDRLANHLMLLCGRGVLNIAEDEILKDFFRKIAPSVMAHAIRFVGRSLVDAEDLPDEITPRFVSLWEWLWSDFRAEHADSPPEHFANFGWWLYCGKFDPNWCLDRLLEVSAIAPMVEPEHKVVEVLASLAASRPLAVVTIADRMVRADKEGWRLHGWRESLLALLKAVLAGQNAEAKAEARNLIDHLALLCQLRN